MAFEAFFKDRVYTLSGGASGIGLATSKLLLNYGAKVSIGDIRFADNLLAELGEEITTPGVKVDDVVILQKVDVRSKSDVDTWIDETVKKWGKLDGAANLAGTIPKDHNIKGIEDADDEQWKFVIDVNVYGIMNCCRAQLKYIGKGEAASSGDKTGKDWSIVNAGSGLSLLGREFTGVYTTSKHAVLGLTRTLAKEVGKRGIRVNCIAPGGTDTPLMRHSMTIGEGSASAEDFSTTALGRMAQPVEIANSVVYLLSDRASFVTGACICVDGGWAC